MPKVLLILFVAFFAVVALGVGGIVYVGYRVKHKAEQVARRYGYDPSAATARSAQRVPACSLLTKDEAEQIVGVPVRVQADGESACSYWGKLTADSPPPGPPSSGANDLKEAEQLTKRILNEVTGVGPSFSINIDWDGGRTELAATRFVAATADPSIKASEDLKGIGDDAVLGPMASMLVFVKGGTSVRIDLRMVPDGRERGIAIAKVVASRLRL